MLYRIQDKLDYYVSFFVDYLGLLRLLQQILQTGWLSRNLLLTVLEARSQRSGCQHGWVLGRAFFLVCRHPFSPWTLTWWRKREKNIKNKLFDVSSKKVLIPPWGLYPHDIIIGLARVRSDFSVMWKNPYKLFGQPNTV